MAFLLHAFIISLGCLTAASADLDSVIDNPPAEPSAGVCVLGWNGLPISSGIQCADASCFVNCDLNAFFIVNPVTGGIRWIYQCDCPSSSAVRACTGQVQTEGGIFTMNCLNYACPNSCDFAESEQGGETFTFCVCPQ